MFVHVALLKPKRSFRRRFRTCQTGGERTFPEVVESPQGFSACLVRGDRVWASCHFCWSPAGPVVDKYTGRSSSVSAMDIDYWFAYLHHVSLGGRVDFQRFRINYAIF